MASEKPPWVTPENLCLFVDLYELTMADSYWNHGLNGSATFSLFVRELPPNRSFLIYAGLESVLDYLENLRFTPEALEYLKSLKLFSEKFLDYLKNFRFAGDIWAVPEGEIVFPPEPLLEVRAPRIEAQIIETFLLNQINFQTMVASKAARIVLAAQGRSVIDMSPRRDQGIDAALKAARSAYLAGCVGTSNVVAGQTYGIPVYGTMAHSYVMSFEDELSAFRTFASDFPNNTVLLIDTYDTLGGARNAVTVARECAARGQKVLGARIDSGDLFILSQHVRKILDENGFPEIKILLSGDLNEHKIEKLLEKGARVDSFGVGTELGTSYDAPALGGVYKLVEDERGYRIKLSAGKVTLPGRKQAWRVFDQSKQMEYDLLALADEPAPAPSAVSLLQPVMKNGRRLNPREPLSRARERCQQSLRALPMELRSMSEHSIQTYSVRLGAQLQALQARPTTAKS
ncbi:nicotinate phosphoribosyltransferase [Candidatus Acetothermia bacterium]|nr:nicotinate phosphoribosyltransferase [Candidatus Acetothermia bacterium]